MAVVVEHGGFGASAAAPIAKDVMTCLFDPAKAWSALLEREKTWGGTPAERMAAKYKVFAAQYGASAPKAASDAAVQAAISRTEGTDTPPVTNGVVTNVEQGEAKGASPGQAQPSAEPSVTERGGPR
jgi:penicillin-binding protein 2